MSQFELLPSDVFIDICTLLSLDEKCYRIVCLSKSINQSFNQSISDCCAGFVSLKAVPRFNDDRDRSINRVRTGRMRYVQYASRIEAQLTAELPAVRRKNVVLSIRKALLTGQLIELTLVEDVRTPVTTIAYEILSDLGRTSVRLQQLSITLKDRVSDSVSSTFWGSLKRCSSLRLLTVFDDGMRGYYQTTLLPHLPDTLECMTMVTQTSEPLTLDIWNQAFSRTDFLPHLQRFILRKMNANQDGTDELNFDRIAKAIGSTIMKQTGTVRPLYLWTTSELSGMHLQHMRKLPLTELCCQEAVNSEVADEFLRPPDHLFPHMKRLFVAGNNPRPLIVFASHRAIEKLVFHCTPLSTANVRALASISTLRHLVLNSPLPLLPAGDLSKVLPSGCWSKVDHLHIQWPEMSEHQMSTCWAAAPNCEHVSMQSMRTRLTNARVLAMMLHHCQFVNRIEIATFGPRDTIQEAQDAFARFPVSSKPYNKLVAVALTTWSEGGAVFHYVLRQLRNAPILELAALGATCKSYVDLFSTGQLRHLRNIDELGHADGSVNELIGKHSKLSKLVEFLLVPCSRTDFEMQRKYYEQGSVMRLADTYAETASEWNRENNLYPVFHRGTDEYGCTGKERFYHAVWGLLNKREQARMATWEAGKYT